ncbi:hypothetical protein [Chroococcidiopsis sp. CCMEE 29]|uniref:hypothetical protein n=1 Tax=Chroococcidiopsis sp. CCMEE 29 TaxID=155894 RepID=UPI002021E9D5|nr:hypothetical protein [Chroococcidiopsis sp. CCMEE 29]
MTFGCPASRRGLGTLYAPWGHVPASYQIRLIAHDLAALTPPPAPLSQAWERGKG